mmetsp:Transcript_1695/g.2461  ORF Transcript_1695/g.2461 Transcript_1695/m.2461 type:complete len:189 (-) Transcript_1695:214-780(-)
MEDLNVHLNSPFTSSTSNKHNCTEFSKMSISDNDHAPKGVMTEETIIRSRSFGSIEDRCQRQQKRLCYQDPKFKQGVLDWCDATSFLNPVAETPNTIPSLGSSSASSIRSDLSTDIQEDVVFSMSPVSEGIHKSSLNRKLGYMKRAEQSTCLASLDETSCYQEKTFMSLVAPFDRKNHEDWGYFVDSS